jgi:hypothetical protein
MALGSTQPLTEMSTGNLPGGKGRPARKADEIINWKGFGKSCASGPEEHREHPSQDTAALDCSVWPCSRRGARHVWNT